MIVIDASVSVKWFIDEPGHRAALAWIGGSERLIAPDFALLETLNVLRRKWRLGNLRDDQLQAAGRVLPGYYDRLVPAALLVADAMDLSAVLEHSLYDCAYLACARMIGAPLITADFRFADKAERAGYEMAVHRLDDD